MGGIHFNTFFFFHVFPILILPHATKNMLSPDNMLQKERPNPTRKVYHYTLKTYMNQKTLHKTKTILHQPESPIINRMDGRYSAKRPIGPRAFALNKYNVLLWRKSLDSGLIPDNQLLTQIAPLHNGVARLFLRTIGLLPWHLMLTTKKN